MQLHAVEEYALRGAVALVCKLRGHAGLRGALLLCHHDWHRVGNAHGFSPGLFAVYLRKSLLDERGEDCAQAVQAPVVALIGRQIREPLREGIGYVIVDLDDRLSLFDEAKEVDTERLFGLSTSSSVKVGWELLLWR